MAIENQNSATLENHFEEILKSMKVIIQETRKELQNSINEEFKQIMEKLGDLKASNERALNIISELKITMSDHEEIEAAANGSQGNSDAYKVFDESSTRGTLNRKDFMFPNENEETFEEVFVEFYNNKDQKFEISSEVEREKFLAEEFMGKSSKTDQECDYIQGIPQLFFRNQGLILCVVSHEGINSYNKVSGRLINMFQTEVIVLGRLLVSDEMPTDGRNKFLALIFYPGGRSNPCFYQYYVIDHALQLQNSLAYIVSELGLIGDSKIIVTNMFENAIVVIECAKTYIQHAYWSSQITSRMSKEELKHSRKKWLIFDPGGALRRHEAAGWLKKMVGIVGGKDLPTQPSEDEFRLALQSGVILCNVLNKVQSGVVSKVVEAPSDSIIIPDGAILSAYQYFENVINFLVAVEEMGIPTFEASVMEQGGKSSRIVNCVLALKSYSEWKKRSGGHGIWKFGGNLKPSPSGKQFVQKNSEPFMNSFPMSLSSKNSLDSFSGENSGNDINEMGSSNPSHVLVHKLLSDKKQEVPIIVENMLSKVTEEFECRLANQNEQMEKTKASKLVKEEYEGGKDRHHDEIKAQDMKQQMLIKLHKYLQILRHGLSTARTDIQFLQMKHQEEVNLLGEHLHSLAYAASRYQKVLGENCKLYNKVQDFKGSIKVYCRVRPFLPGKPSRWSTVANIGDGKITLITPSKNGKAGRKLFTFNQVLGPSATQEEVLSDMQPLIRSVFDWYNVCIFAYGQTGSGKTYTMSGANELMEENLCVNYRALSALFVISEQRKIIICYEVSVQMMEIYNEQVGDLLVTNGASANKRLLNDLFLDMLHS